MSTPAIATRATRARVGGALACIGMLLGVACGPASQSFAFTDQRSYDTPNVVHPGDTLTTTCTWMNTTPISVSFGTSTTAEMCYDFVYSYPAHSLPNPNGGGIEGSTNMCLK